MSNSSAIFTRTDRKPDQPDAGRSIVAFLGSPLAALANTGARL